MTEREQAVKALALRAALSLAFQEFYASKAAPEVWEQLVATWDDETMHAMTLILDEEDALRKDLGMETARKTKVNETSLRQKIEQMRVTAHALNQNK
ncbi:MAG: hypothetical protein AAB383_00615 [Patescibacteria group bacterium]